MELVVTPEGLIALLVVSLITVFVGIRVFGGKKYNPWESLAVICLGGVATIWCGQVSVLVFIAAYIVGCVIGTVWFFVRDDD